MLLPILLSLAAIWILGIVVTVVHIRRAPVAVEDDQGFHVIEEANAGKMIEFRDAALRAN